MKPDWASKKVEKKCFRVAVNGPPVMFSKEATRLLSQEHQRAVRIVKRIKREYWTSDNDSAAENALADVLAALERGRTTRSGK